MTWSTASGRKEIELGLRHSGALADAEIDLAETALLLAALDRPRVALERYRHHLAELAESAAALARELDVGRSLDGQAQVLRQVMVEHFGYRGDELTYDDLQNANLMRVIDRRKGLPVALGILYIATARAQGWTLVGLNFPGHFLLRLEAGGARAIIDPFRDGEARQPAELRVLLKALAGDAAELDPSYTDAVANREILLRLQNNIKLRRLRQGQIEPALETLESMLMIAPAKAALWHEAGLLHRELGNLRAAALALEQVLELEGDAESRRAAAQALQEIKRKLN